MLEKSVPPELLLIDKPKGLSSFDVIRRLRKKYGVRKMGHSGTLDPLASGLLIIGIGSGTKKLARLVKLTKTYEAEILLGVKTSTGDMEGTIEEQKAVKKIDARALKKALKSVQGKLRLRVPLYSAVKVKGRALYKYARSGESALPPEKEMEIFGTELIHHRPEGNLYVIGIRMEVSSGTYVRSVAEEIGRRLGFPAAVKELRRTGIGPYRVEDAHGLMP